jgi:hypothetical protein
MPNADGIRFDLIASVRSQSKNCAKLLTSCERMCRFESGGQFDLTLIG